MGCRSSLERALLATSLLLVAGVGVAGLFAREIAARRPSTDGDVIDPLSQAARSYEQDGGSYSPGFWMTWRNRVVCYSGHDESELMPFRLGSGSVIPYSRGYHGNFGGQDFTVDNIYGEFAPLPQSLRVARSFRRGHDRRGGAGGR